MEEKKIKPANKRIRNFIFCFLGFVLLLQINMFYKSRKEYQSNYNFIVSDIELSQQGKVTFFDSKNQEVYFFNYATFKGDNYERGDSVVKTACSEYLYVYRKDNAGKYQIYDKKTPNINYPVSWMNSECK